MVKVKEEKKVKKVAVKTSKTVKNVKPAKEIKAKTPKAKASFAKATVAKEVIEAPKSNLEDDKQKIIDKFGQKKGDTGSPEVQVALLSLKIDKLA